ncbi:ThuA domain-containing protein [Viscerimonas tarda]
MNYKKLVLAFFLFATVLSATAKPIKTLIVTGQNNHNWQVSHVVLKQILENTGLFIVDFAISPEKGKDMNHFIVDFSPYKLVLLDYNGDNWPKATRDGFLKYVKKGGGVVVYHAADNAFTGWNEYNEIIALGGWNNRDERSGPWVYWQGGQLIKDESAGRGGSHGRAHEYVLTVRNDKHPIIKGLPKQWKHATDELYDRMRGPGNIKDMLYTAYSEPETNGSGREEPLIFTVNYGKARIFHIMLGHVGKTAEDNPAMQCAGFQTILLRGCEWAATGKVKQAVPADFPTASTVSYRKLYKENGK